MAVLVSFPYAQVFCINNVLSMIVLTLLDHFSHLGGGASAVAGGRTFALDITAFMMLTVNFHNLCQNIERIRRALILMF